jgi:hypothetical protein
MLCRVPMLSTRLRRPFNSGFIAILLPFPQSTFQSLGALCRTRTDDPFLTMDLQALLRALWGHGFPLETLVQAFYRLLYTF